MLRSMSELAIHGAFEYAMLIDADTAVNVTNAAKFVASLPGAGSTHVYTGRCLQRSLHEPEGPQLLGAGTGSSRRDVARFIELRRKRGSSVTWPLTIPPSPGGGPGLLFSRGLLASVHNKLSACEPFVEPMAFGDSIYSGGDSMLTRCFATFNVRCANERDLQLQVPARCPFRHGCALVSLFRKNPPWFYIAARSVSNTKLAQRAQPDSVLGLNAPLDETIAFHHVKPSSRLSSTRPDPRCAVRLRTDPKSRAGWWGSTCMPNFCLIGAPRSGTRSLLDALVRHPDVVMPARRSLQFFTSERSLSLLGALNWTWHTPVIRATMVAGTEADVSSARAAGAQLKRAYANSFPAIDPRDFKVTGEASPSYLYNAQAPVFFAHAHFKLLQLVVVLRQPTARSLAELGRRRELDGSMATAPTMAESTLLGIAAAARSCGMAALYAACSACPPAEAVAPSWKPSSDITARVRMGSEEWRALWRSWYHLFLPRWLALGQRLLVLYTGELHGAHAAVVSAKLGQFLRLPPVQLAVEAGVGEADLPESTSASVVARQLNVTEALVQALRELTSDSVRLTDELLRATGRRGVPLAWSQRVPFHSRSVVRPP